MAQMLMEKNRLVALQIQTFAKPDGKVVRTSVLDGDLPIGSEVETPYSALGLAQAPELAVSNPLPMSLPDSIGAQLTAAAQRLEKNEPLWLHISQDSFKLAMFPWESEVHRLIGKPLIRVPNFLDDPFQPTKLPVIAICISIPLAKGDFSNPFDLIESQLTVLNVLAGDAITKTDVHIFADAQLNQGLMRLVAPYETSGSTSITVHRANPDLQDRIPRASSSIQNSDSPWLSWMTQTLEGRSVDIFHFICPGYYNGAHGALALAESPVSNSDRHWSRFVGADELNDFLNRHGTSAVSITPAGEPGWALGLRLLAFELGWLRPGPVLVTDAGEGAVRGLQCAYEILYGFAADDISAMCSNFFSCHPRYFAEESSPDRAHLESASAFGMSDLAAGILRSSNTSSPMFSTEYDAPAVQSVPRRGTLLPDISSSLAERYVRQSEVSLSKLEANSEYRSWENRGTANAVSFVRDLLSKIKPLP